MIKYFRKIRQKLLSENKFSKYLIYAIGEIVLVVIGILIALQINNWNSNRAESLLETKMLKEIKIGLESDLKDVEYNLNLHTRILQSQQLVLNWLKSDNPYTDSLSFHFFNVVNTTNFLSNNGPYETLKGIGIRLIKNDSVREEILNIYELKYKDYRSVLKQVNDYSFLITTQENEKYFQLTSPYLQMKPLNSDNIKSENGYAYHIQTLMSWNKYFLEEKIKPIKFAIEKTIETIENELNTRNGG